MKLFRQAFQLCSEEPIQFYLAVQTPGNKLLMDSGWVWPGAQKAEFCPPCQPAPARAASIMVSEVQISSVGR